MNRIVMKSRVNREGILHLSVPVGIAEAENEVQVTVESLTTQKRMSQSEWHQWVDSMAGSWQGSFERPPQVEFEEREPIS